MLFIQSIQKKQRMIERPFHPRLMTLPGQPITQPRPRRPKHRVKARQVQLPVGPTKHTTRLSTPTTTQNSGSLSKTPSSQLLLKQLQGGGSALITSPDTPVFQIPPDLKYKPIHWWKGHDRIWLNT